MRHQTLRPLLSMRSKVIKHTSQNILSRVIHEKLLKLFSLYLSWSKLTSSLHWNKYSLPSPRLWEGKKGEVRHERRKTSGSHCTQPVLRNLINTAPFLHKIKKEIEIVPPKSWTVNCKKILTVVCRRASSSCRSGGSPSWRYRETAAPDASRCGCNSWRPYRLRADPASARSTGCSMT